MTHRMRAAVVVFPGTNRERDMALALARATGGGTAWLGDDAAHPAVPALRLVGPGEPAAGPGWIGLRRHGAHVVTGQQAQRLLAGWLVLPLVLVLMLMAWRREGRA